MSGPRSRAVASLAAFALAFLPAGCGGASNDSGALSAQEYAKRFVVLERDFSARVSSTQTKVQGAPTQAKRLAALSELEAALTRYADGVETLAAPSAAKVAQRRLVAKVRKSAGDVRDVSAGVQANSPPRSAQARRELAKDVAAIRSSLQEIRGKLRN